MRREEEESEGTFKKGMTLTEYLSEMKIRDKEVEKDEGPEHEEDLFETCRRAEKNASRKLIEFEIRESDEDNYDDDKEQEQGYTLKNAKTNISAQLVLNDHRDSNKKITHLKDLKAEDASQKGSMNQTKGFRVRQQSNSPFNHIKKDQHSPSPDKNFARTLQGGQWLPKKNLTPLTTFYGKNGKSNSKVQNGRQFDKLGNDCREKQMKKKNTKEIEYVIKYERDKTSKYFLSQCPEILDIRIEGITDRLIDRREVLRKMGK